MSSTQAMDFVSTYLDDDRSLEASEFIASDSNLSAQIEEGVAVTAALQV